MTATADLATLGKADDVSLTTAELREIDRIYDRLDAEWSAAGTSTRRVRAPFSSGDIVEWRTLTADERVKDLRGYAWASDRIARSNTEAKAAVPCRAADQRTSAVQPRMPCVLNMRDIRGPLPPNAVRIDRRTPLGNRFVIGRDGTREEVVAKYETWIVTQPHLMAMIERLRGRDVACWCNPLPCHGDIIVRLANRPRLRCE